MKDGSSTIGCIVGVAVEVVVEGVLGLDVGDTVAGTSTLYVSNAGSYTKGVHTPIQQ